MSRIPWILLAIVVLVLSLALEAWAAQAQIQFIPIDNLGVTIFRSIRNVWIPLIALLAICTLVINCFVGFFQIGPKMLGFAIGMCVLGGGLPLMASLFGESLVTALVL